MNQSGNVLFLLLLAVALFAALSYAVSSSTRSSGGSISDDKARIYASQLIQYGASMRNSLIRMKLSHGCTDDMIDLSNSVYVRYNGSTITPANPDAPTDYRCHLFDPNGGGVSPVIIASSALLSPTSPLATNAKPGHGSFSIAQIPEVGTSGPPGTASSNELFLSINYIDKKVCMAVNDMMKIPNDVSEPPTQTSSGDTTYTFPSPFEKNGTLSIGVNGATVFCRKGGTDKYIFTQVLIER